MAGVSQTISTYSARIPEPLCASPSMRTARPARFEAVLAPVRPVPMSTGPIGVCTRAATAQASAPRRAISG